MALKSASVMAADVASFIERAKAAIVISENFQKRLVDDPDFARLWDSDSAAALRLAGIDPEARQEMGMGPYDEGAQCNWCITPNGNTCHC